MKKTIALVVLLTLAGCAPYQLVPAGKVTLGSDAEFVTDVAWNGKAAEEGYTLTQDGPALQSVIFHLGIADGKTLYKQLDKESQHNPILALAGVRPDEVSYRFRKSMTEPEIMDLFSSSLGAIFKAPVEASGLAPADFAGKPGFRFDYLVTGLDGVQRKGLVAGAVIADKLFLVNYVGTAIYHFDHYRPQVDSIISSFMVKEKAG